jgi:NAD(P)-dependent dehydrogenase (short-subunit alcohol dehydrogenase family)
METPNFGTSQNRPRILLTGATEGIGKELARGLARSGAHLILVNRNAAKAEPVAQQLRADFPNLELDLHTADVGSLDQMRRVVAEVKAHHRQLDGIIANAGFMGYLQRTLTEAGHEITLSVNVLGHLVLIHELWPLLRQSAHGARIVTTGSVSHRIAQPRLDDIHLAQSYKPAQAYAHSKLLLLMYTRALARRLPAPHLAACADPGSVYTGILRTYPQWLQTAFRIYKPFTRSLETGAATQLYLATAADARKFNGAYLRDLKPFRSTRASEQADLQEAAYHQLLHLAGVTDNI